MKKRIVQSFIVIVSLIFLVSITIHAGRSDGYASSQITAGEIIALMEDNLPELTSYEEYISNVGEGKVNLTIQVYPMQKQRGQNYYPVYVGEQWSDHMVNWDWFYVNEAVDTIYWYDVIEGELHSLEEWRKSERYRR